MSWTRYFRRRRWDEERSRELDAYLRMEIDDNLARGMSPENARSAALRKLGNPASIREEIYHMNTVSFVENLGQDLRYALRMLRLNPSFTLVAIASLALGIGANTAMFQLLDAVGMRSLPVGHPEQLAQVRIAGAKRNCCAFNDRYSHFTTAIWEQIRDRQQAFSGMAAWGSYGFNLSTGGEVHNAETLMVNGDYFHVLGVLPALGRVLNAADDTRGCTVPSAVLSDTFWRRQYGAQPGAVGQKLTLEGKSFEIVGVTPPGFFGMEVGSNFDIAIPLCAEPLVQGQFSMLDVRWGWWLAATGRLKPGWTVQRASAHLAALSAGIFQDTVPDRFDAAMVNGFRAFVLQALPGAQGYSDLRTDFGGALRILLAITGLVLLIACANLANLMLARASAREREIAIRLAVGASRGRLIRQLLVESLLLSGAGAVMGIWIAATLNRQLVGFLTTRSSAVFLDMAPDWRILGFTAALAVLTSMFFGLTPALRATRTAPGTVMKATSRGLTAGRERFGLRRVLVVTQVALSLVLLVGALLFVRSFHNLVSIDPGFRQDGILEADFDVSRLTLGLEASHAMQANLVRRMAAVPGVAEAAYISIMPLSGSQWGRDVAVDNEQKGTTKLAVVSPGYFRTMQTTLLAGRDFNERDSAGGPAVAIVNQTFVSRNLGPGDPIGRIFHLQGMRGTPDPPYQIVGVVRDSKYLDLRDKPTPCAFLAAAQDTKVVTYVPMVIHSNMSTAALIPALKHAAAEIHPQIGYEFHLFRDEVRETVQREQLMATLSGFFGVLAALLATIGLYGVMSYMVARRKNEIGIRLALGAVRGDVIRMVLGEAGLLLAVGLAVGTLLAIAAAQTAGAMLFGLKPRDPVTFAFSIALLAAVAAAAAWVPARRAANLDPTVALREE